MIQQKTVSEHAHLTVGSRKCRLLNVRVTLWTIRVTLPRRGQIDIKPLEQMREADERTLHFAPMGLLTGATMRPQISLAGARIASRLSLNRAPLDAPTDGKALVADGATVGGSAVLTELRVR